MADQVQNPQNRLAREKSPYLLQHAANPVDWYPWGAEALEKAKREDKVIFLSIGYSTCHWCHVMAHESFENQEIAQVLNELFVPIKVDREERPDLDQIYMSAVQTMTGSGGWPLTAFLTPDLKPFAGGTYFPPEDRGGRVGMKNLLPRIADIWKTRRQEVETSGQELTRLLENAKGRQGAGFNKEILSKAFHTYASRFDSQYGGFGDAPKFPSSHQLSFLLFYGHRSSEPDALNMVEKTLDAMARGGIYDQIGGGFHRYSTDERWLVPHFEKMLYDQALLAKTYLEAYQITKKPFYAHIAKEILDYILREMTSPEGGFYSAEDADSEGEEGKFYIWTPEEFDAVLGADAVSWMNYLDVTPEGNFEHGKSILNIPFPFEEWPADLHRVKIRLREYRSRRIRPHLDDKILTCWNALVISALARGSAILQEPRYLQAALRSAQFIQSRLMPTGRLLRRYRDGEASILAYQDDYAFWIEAQLDLYEAVFDSRWLASAVQSAEEMDRLFWDKEHGGFYFTAADAEKLPVRMKEYYDGAIPSGNSVAALSLLRLARMTGQPLWEELAVKTLHSNSVEVEYHPVAFPVMLTVLGWIDGSREIVIAGKKDTPPFESLLSEIRRTYLPDAVLLHRPENAETVVKLAPFLEPMVPTRGQAAVYVCRNRTCRLPASDVQGLRERLKNP